MSLSSAGAYSNVGTEILNSVSRLLGGTRVQNRRHLDVKSGYRKLTTARHSENGVPGLSRRRWGGLGCRIPGWGGLVDLARRMESSQPGLPCIAGSLAEGPAARRVGWEWIGRVS
jgi:hypothetical protein